MRYLRLLRRLALHELRIARLEQHMSRVDDVITDLNTATDEIAADLEALRGEVAGLDSATADKLSPIVERLRALGADPQNPVPDGDAAGGTLG